MSKKQTRVLSDATIEAILSDKTATSVKSLHLNRSST